MCEWGVILTALSGVHAEQGQISTSVVGGVFHVNKSSHP